MPDAPTKRGRSIRMATLELLLMLSGILFVRREIWQAHVLDLSLPTWQEGLLLPLSAIDGAITGLYGCRRRNVEHTPAYQKWLRLGVPAFFLLYVACAALCERLAVGTFAICPGCWRTVGFVLVVGGMALRLWSQVCTPSVLEPAYVSTTESDSQLTATSAFDVASASETTTPPCLSSLDSLLALSNGQFPRGPHRLLRYPDASGRLLALCGVSLCFNAWLPLLAVPGSLILLKWHITDQESFRISQLGEPYREYRRHTWALIPYIY